MQRPVLYLFTLATFATCATLRVFSKGSRSQGFTCKAAADFVIDLNRPRGVHACSWAQLLCLLRQAFGCKLPCYKLLTQSKLTRLNVWGINFGVHNVTHDICRSSSHNGFSWLYAPVLPHETPPLLCSDNIALMHMRSRQARRVTHACVLELP